MNEQNIEAKENSKSLLIDTYLNYTSSKFSKIQIQVIVINCLVLLMDGVHMTLLSTLIVPIKSEFNISDFQISSISSLMFILVGYVHIIQVIHLLVITNCKYSNYAF